LIAILDGEEPCVDGRITVPELLLVMARAATRPRLRGRERKHGTCRSKAS